MECLLTSQWRGSVAVPNALIYWSRGHKRWGMRRGGQVGVPRAGWVSPHRRVRAPKAWWASPIGCEGVPQGLVGVSHRL